MGYEVKLITPWMDKDQQAELIKLAKFDDWKIRHLENGDCSYLLIFYNGELIKYFSDRGEPEDNSFSRDWSWINGELERAYSLGVKDGSKAA